MERPTEGLRARLRQQRPIPLAAELACAGGELLALVGPSGSGKSTILRTLAGIYRPHEGTIAVGGETWLDSARGVEVASRERSVGFVFHKKVGDPVAVGEPIVTVHVGKASRREEALARLREAIVVAPEAPPRGPLVLDILS